MTHPLAALLKDVPRYTPPYTRGDWFKADDVLAALETATTPATEKGGDAHDQDSIDARPATSPGVTAGAVPPDLVEAIAAAEKAQEWMRIPDHAHRFGWVDVEKWLKSRPINAIPALIALATAQAAQIAGLEAEKQEMAAGMVTLSHDQSMAEAEAATLRAEVERLRGAVKAVLIDLRDGQCCPKGRAYGETYDTMMEVERNPTGAFMAIEAMDAAMEKAKNDLRVILALIREVRDD